MWEDFQSNTKQHRRKLRVQTKLRQLYPLIFYVASSTNHKYNQSADTSCLGLGYPLLASVIEMGAVRNTNSIGKVNKSENGNIATLAWSPWPKAAQTAWNNVDVAVPVDDVLAAPTCSCSRILNPKRAAMEWEAVCLWPSTAGSQTQNISNFSADVDEWRWTRGAGGNGTGRGQNATTSPHTHANRRGHWRRVAKCQLSGAEQGLGIGMAIEETICPGCPTVMFQSDFILKRIQGEMAKKSHWILKSY